MRRRCFLSLLAPSPTPNLLPIAETFAQTLLRASATAAWPAVIDTRDFSVPQANVPAPPGIRESDRAVGGSNLYHDAVTLRAFHALSRLTHNPTYARAASDAIAFHFTHAQSPSTGLLAWGEHLYFHLFRRQVALERRHHELLEWSPPWDLLHAVNPAATARAIAGLRYHHFSPRPGTLFNRHASYDPATFNKPDGAQPWIKHAAQYAAAFAFLHSKTRDPQWLAWARADASFYWNRRNPQTNLTLGCIGDPRPSSALATGQIALHAYWLHKAARHIPDLRPRSLALIRAWQRHSYDPQTQSWRTALHLDASPASNQTAQPWHFAYGESELLPYGRIAAHFAATERDPLLLDAARRVALTAASLEGLGFALNLALDLHQLEPHARWLDQANHYAAQALDRFWRASNNNGLFTRLAADPYYESKTGPGFLLAALLRLHEARAGRTLPGDWSL